MTQYQIQFCTAQRRILVSALNMQIESEVARTLADQFDVLQPEPNAEVSPWTDCSVLPAQAITDEQRSLMIRALNSTSFSNDEDAEEAESLMIGLDTIPQYEEDEPGMIHGLCF